MTTLEQAMRSGRGLERTFHCPAHDDNNASASVNVLKGLWVCYACGARGRVDGNLMFDKLDDFEGEIVQMLAKGDPVYYPESWVDLFWRTDHPYWHNRFSQAAIDHFKLGFSTEHDQPVYPARTIDGRVLGVVRRALSPMAKPKYRYPEGVDMHQHLFNATHELTSQVLICEGAADVIAAWEAGATAVATYGDRITEHQVRLLHQMGVQTAFIGYDADEAGRKGAMQVTEALEGSGIQASRLTWAPDIGKDLAEMDVTVRQTVLAPLVPSSEI